MTQRLYEMLKDKYFDKRFSVSHLQQKLNISFDDESLPKEKEFMNVFEINGFAKNYFNYFCFVRPVFGKEEKMSEIVGAYVWFNPDEKLKSDLYRGHSFWIPRFYPPFEMELSTGTRFLLGKKQRKNYFGFVNDIFDKFIYNVNEFKKE